VRACVCALLQLPKTRPSCLTGTPRSANPHAKLHSVACYAIDRRESPRHCPTMLLINTLSRVDCRSSGCVDVSPRGSPKQHPPSSKAKHSGAIPCTTRNRSGAQSPRRRTPSTDPAIQLLPVPYVEQDALSRFMNAKYNFGIVPEDVCVLPSATAALSAVVQAVVDPGDEVRLAARHGDSQSGSMTPTVTRPHSDTTSNSAAVACRATTTGAVCVTYNGLPSTIACVFLPPPFPPTLPPFQVVIFEPFFPWYPAIVRAAGGVPRFVTLDSRCNFAVPPLEETARAFSRKTKLCMWNSPHNPTSRVTSAEDVQTVARLCVEFDAICLSDEVYESCIFPGTQQPHIPMAMIPGMRDRTITVGSASKLLSVTGWRVGWAMSHSPPLLDATATMHSFTTFCAPTPLQYATAHAIGELIVDSGASGAPVGGSGGGGCGPVSLDISGVAATFERNAQTLAAVLEQHLGLQTFPCQSGYFIVADVASTGVCPRGCARVDWCVRVCELCECALQSVGEPVLWIHSVCRRVFTCTYRCHTCT
jgi:aspartate/methionine/tyrosine aminotransferase